MGCLGELLKFLKNRLRLYPMEVNVGFHVPDLDNTSGGRDITDGA
jgi:hypothetical protein